MKRIFITINDYERIMGMIENAALQSKLPDTIEQFVTRLRGAHVLPQENISTDIVTMNSRVQMTKVDSNDKFEITITYPQEANNLVKKISVFSPIGIALLGSKVGDVVSWKIPSGIGEFRVDSVTYQPEAVGDYHL
jgi:regulator of nucleoside diphosphate kinase